MNLGLVAETQRLPDSADAVIVVEPVIGSTSRTKGSLFLLVTGAGGRKLRDATKAVADRIRDDYYYDLSAGISVCLRKSIRAANNMLLHSPDRPLLAAGETGPIGVALAVVRGNELYVATTGPAEAYMVRQARLLTLPDANPDSGLPAPELEGPEVWHGEIAAGDCLILISPNVTRRTGLGPIQDAVLQLHPQAAVEQIHRQFGSGSLGSTGGDGILFVEATEVASTHKAAPLKPVWPGESMAGAPEHSPIPLADTVVGGVAAMQTSARHVQVAADGWLRRGVYNLFDRMPERPMSRGRVTPMIVRRERQQRAAIAIIGLLAVIAIVGTSLYIFGGATRNDNIDQQTKAQQAYAAAKADLDAVYGGGKHLVDSDPKAAAAYLTDAYQKLQVALQNNYPPAQLADLKAQVIAGLDDYYNITTVQPQVVLSFTTDDLEGLVLGPDGAAYVLDNTVNIVYRVNLQTGAKVPVVAVGQEPQVGGGIVGNPRLLAVGGGDVLVLDSFNSLWRWHPAAGDATGRGALVRINIPDNANWGIGARVMGTFITNLAQNQYNFYIVVPSQKRILKYQPATDGSGFPTAGRARYLNVDQDVSSVDDMYVDGKVYLVDKGVVTQYELGQAVRGWTVDPPPDTTGTTPIRAAPHYTRLTADNPADDQGTFYAYDVTGQRIVAFKKIDGTIVGQYMVPPTTNWFSNLKGMFVTTGTGGINPMLYWVESGSLMSASLTPSGSPVASPSGSVKPSTSGSVKPSTPAVSPSKKS
jgi:type II secretory pathway pseudopilin PulG